MILLIVESPTKAKTIAKFLDKEYCIESSYGHIRDLPKSKLGIDVENNFQPSYVIPVKSRSVIKYLRDLSKKSGKIILATDEDREGEAIAWHLKEVLNLEDPERIAFHEITKKAIEDALKIPRKLDLNLIDAQQARRILDRLVGYKLSPFLWKKIAAGLSAGRVQSVAVRLIAEREKEIGNFKPQEYWTITVLFREDFESNLIKINNKILDKLDIKNKKEAEEIVRDLKNQEFKISKIEKKEINKNPLPPFITSTLQQEASKRLGFSAKQTMFLAQRLYEKGSITYMRTDSVNLSKDSMEAAKKWLEKNLGPDYSQAVPRSFKSKSRLAQEAHEAIRPTNIDKLADKDEKAGEERLYELIWKRFVASQMPSAKVSSTSIEVSTGKYVLKSTGQTIIFDGFLKIWPQQFSEKGLPALNLNQILNLKEIKPGQHFTEPPPRYTEASLIKTLEEYGIGRPSTYAPIISTIQERNYVKKEKGHFYPTEIGELVIGVLIEHFPEIVDINFTAKMEEDLDKIAEGKEKWQSVINKFYQPFAAQLELKYQKVSKKELTEEKTDEICEKCGKPMNIKLGRFGKFLACSGFPECKNTKQLPKEPPRSTGLKCPKCQQGELVERRVGRGRAKGRIFWGCSRYPDCDYATWENPNKKTA